MGREAQEGELPTVGAWPAEDTVHLWEKLPNHRESWAPILGFHWPSAHAILAQGLPSRDPRVSRGAEVH
eukprot:5483041-Pyramimonas_sp.AAC.1